MSPAAAGAGICMRATSGAGDDFGGGAVAAGVCGASAAAASVPSSRGTKALPSAAATAPTAVLAAVDDGEW